MGVKDLMIKTSIKQEISISIILVLLFISIYSPVLAQMPVIEIKEEKETYIPSATYGDYDYYVLPPGSNFSSIKYLGTTTNDAYYTKWQSVDSPYFFDRGSSALVEDAWVTESFLRNTSRKSYHPFFSAEPYPTAVRIDTTRNPEFEFTRKQPISLHMDYSFTFLAEKKIDYWGWINSSDPFFLDIYSRDNTQGTISFSSALPDLLTLEVGKKRMTFPIFPIDEEIQNFTLSFNDNTLVTLTPHPWTFPDYIPIIEVNTSVSGDINQGGISEVDQKTGETAYLENDIFSIRMFNISLEEDRYYKIYLNLAYDSTYGGPTAPMTFLYGDNYEIISGDISSLNEDGITIYSEQSENITLILYSPGYSRAHYTIYFQNIAPITRFNTLPLLLNTNVSLDYETYYTFTLDRAHMMAINWTSHYDLEFYVQGVNPNEWIFKAYEDFFLPEPSNLVGDIINDIGDNWRFMPAGTYAVVVTDYSVDSQIRFTAISVLQPSDSPVTVDENSIYAFEFPLTWNRLNLINISTTDQINQSIRYEWNWIGKYLELITPSPGNAWIGNQQNNSIWIGYDENETILRSFHPLLDYEIPILIIHPYEAKNITDPINSFKATLSITNIVASNQNYDTGDGIFIPQNGISRSTSYAINDDIINETDQMYGIPLNLAPYSIYNITVLLQGNYTNTGDLNASFDIFSLFGGNLYTLEIFNTLTRTTTDTNDSQSLLILTVSTTSYLYLGIARGNNGTHLMNATLDVFIEQIPTTPMEFNLAIHEYNAMVSSLEVFSEQLLATQIEASEMKKPGKAPGFELALTLCMLIISVRFTRKKRKD